VNIYPFIEAEKVCRRNVKRACELLKVSRAAFCQHLRGIPSPRERQDAELAGQLARIRYDPHDPQASDVDLWQREITVRGKGGKARVVKITHDATRALDRYIRVRARHAQAWRRPLWLGVNNRGPLTVNGIYQMIARLGRECGVTVHPHRLRHHFSHTWLDRGEPKQT
jgi:Phage integrase family